MVALVLAHCASTRSSTSVESSTETVTDPDSTPHSLFFSVVFSITGVAVSNSMPNIIVTKDAHDICPRIAVTVTDVRFSSSTHAAADSPGSPC
ncbi:hypothetical protein BV898_14101 [Hypsibius exemplaris]|uniref:Uncharacterized protein n=1 Tax=Hypsibius exemplaris TaxID=2072580 RepID=A0A1W0W8U2_HYPEX|nr:hypothetical protein BV898_14101 [Hypsibius exemplaris]